MRAYLIERDTTHQQQIAQRDQHITAREQHIAELKLRIEVLEEQFRLPQLKRFAPSSEKYSLQGCLFNAAEASAQAAPESSSDQPDAQLVSVLDLQE